MVFIPEKGFPLLQTELEQNSIKLDSIVVKVLRIGVSLVQSYPSTDARKDKRMCVFLVYACYKNHLFLSAGISLLNSTQIFPSFLHPICACTFYRWIQRKKMPAGCTVSCFISNFVKISSLITSEDWRVIPGSSEICFLFSHNGRKTDSGSVINRLKSSFIVRETTVYR